MTEQRAQTAPKAASGWMASGVAVTIVGAVVLLASGYAGLTDQPTEHEADPFVTLAWIGWIALLSGVACLWVGVLRLVQHADRHAGVTYPAAQIGVRDERQADTYAARLLIDVGAYVEAEQVVGSDRGALARELGVTARLVELWRADYLARVGVVRKTPTRVGV